MHGFDACVYQYTAYTDTLIDVYYESISISNCDNGITGILLQHYML